jgi:clan AA aspartic protease (TIGR02281 family)
MQSPSRWLLRILTTTLAVLITFGTSFSGAVALAADDDLSEGVRLYGEKSFKDAIGHLKRVSDKTNKPTALYYQALCLQGLGDSTASVQLFHRIKDTYPATREGQMVTAYFSNVGGARAPASVPVRQVATTQTVSSSAMGDHLPDSCTVPFHREISNHMFVNVLINGRPAKVIFDTGASTCLFGKQQLSNIGVNYDVTGKGQAMGVGSGVVNFDRANLRITLGDITKTINTAVAPSMNTESLLGQDFFSDFRYDVDSSAGVIHFQKKGSRSYEAMDTINIPFRTQGREMLVTARVNGRDCEMIFDTGAHNNIFPIAIWQRLGLQIPSDAHQTMAGGVGGMARGFSFNADRIELGAVMKTNVPVMVIESGLPYPLLGQEFFKDKRFSIDNDSSVIKFVH